MPADNQRASALRPIGFAPFDVSRMVHRKVVQEHASEAAFLWSLRQRASIAPHYKLKHLARLDDRVEAHLQGLRVAGSTGWRIAQSYLEQGEAGNVFVFAYLAFSEGEQSRIDHAIRVGLADETFVSALQWALAWPDAQETQHALAELLKSSEPACRRIALGAYAIRRLDPGRALADSLTSPDAGLRRCAAHLAGCLRRADLLTALEEQLNDRDPELRLSAGWASCLIGSNLGPQATFDVISKNSSSSREAMMVSMRCGDHDWVRARIREMARDPLQLRNAVVAAGEFGDPASVPWLIGLTADALLARVAGESIALITGLDIDQSMYKQDAPDAPPDPASPEDDNLRWPRPESLRVWWERDRSRFIPGRRYLLGSPVSGPAAVEALRKGYQRQRASAAVDLMREESGASLFPTSDRGNRQRRSLAA